MNTPTRHTVLRLLYTLSIGMLAAAAAVAVGQTASPATAPTTAPLVDQHGPTIKATYAKSFLIGMAGDIPGNYSEAELALIKENFGVVTPENCLKTGPVHSVDKIWNFELPDDLEKMFASKNIR